MDFEVSLEDLYVGNFIELARFKAVPKPAAGTRQCNCRTEMKTIQMGPGRFQVGREGGREGVRKGGGKEGREGGGKGSVKKVKEGRCER